MTNVSLDSWKALEDLSTSAKTTASNVIKLISKIQEIATEGSLGRYEEVKKKLIAEIKQIDEQILSFERQIFGLNCKVAELQIEVEKLCHEYKISGKIFSSGPNLIVYPLVVHFGLSDKDIEIIIGSEKLKSNRADYIAKRIQIVYSKQIDPKNFLKSMRAAYTLLLKSENQKDVSLEEIRQLMSIGGDSTSQCSKDQFGAYLQTLYAQYGHSNEKDFPRFIPIAAAARSYLLIGRDGTSITVGSVSFNSTRAR